MSIETDLKKDGIEVIETLDTLKINSIARNLSQKICDTFPNYGFNQNELFIQLSRINMYKAKMPEGMAEANYFYKNTSIYFNEHIANEDLEEFAIHECIHYLQEVKDKRNYLIRMGLCDYTEFKIYGLGLNEAAVQLISSKINDIPKEYVKYFGISFETTSPSYYPLECCLVNQLAYITGEDILFESTLKSNDNFKKAFSELTSPKTFMAIQNAIDDILNREEEIIKINNKIAQIDDRNKKVDGMIEKIEELKHEITLTFMRTQNLIISSYFDREFNAISDLEGIETYRKKLYTFRDFIGYTEGYTFFNDYYVSKMEELEYKYNLLENGEVETALKVITRRENMFIRVIKTLRKLIFGTSSQKQKATDN
ncbi:MAG: hypothetical protein HFJ34_06295 [Clostridia bacterium]|nr:hypothetical protein [Clostridia bacterium]